MIESLGEQGWSADDFGTGALTLQDTVPIQRRCSYHIIFIHEHFDLFDVANKVITCASNSEHPFLKIQM